MSLDGPHLHDPEAGKFVLGGGAGTPVLDTATSGSTRELYVVHSRGHAALPGGRILMWEDAGEPSWLARRLDGNRNVRNPPRSRMLTREGPVPVPGDPVESGFRPGATSRPGVIPVAGFVPLPEYGVTLKEDGTGAPSGTDAA